MGSRWIIQPAGSASASRNHDTLVLILGSASPRRLALLQSIGIVPELVIPADIDETPLKGELPEAYALRVAKEKAERIAADYPHATILSADTVVACGRRILPKAETISQAEQCLKILSGRRHRVYTAVALKVPTMALRTRICMTHVKFNRLTKENLSRYLATDEWQGKAGGYAIQGSAGAFIPQINGSYSNVVGLPLHMVESLLTNIPV